MALPHTWRECRPAVLAVEPGNPEATRRLQANIEQIWSELSDQDKQCFHQFTCHNRHGADQLQVVRKIKQRLDSLDKATG